MAKLILSKVNSGSLPSFSLSAPVQNSRNLPHARQTPRSAPLHLLQGSHKPTDPDGCPFLPRSSGALCPPARQRHCFPMAPPRLQVCGRPWMPPSVFLFLPSHLLRQLGFCSRTIAWFCPGPWGLSLGLPKPICALQGSERDLFCVLGFLAKDFS